MVVVPLDFEVFLEDNGVVTMIVAEPLLTPHEPLDMSIYHIYLLLVIVLETSLLLEYLHTHQLFVVIPLLLIIAVGLVNV